MVDFIDEEDRPQEQGATPTLTEVFKQAMDAMASELRVSMPGTIIRYDHKKQLADVKPDFKRKYKDGKVEDAPLIYNVPVKHPRAGDAFIHMPLAKGHKVVLQFSDRSLEKWLSAGKEHDPEDTRKHHMSDAFAYPGGYPFSDTASVANGQDLIMKNKDLEVRIKKNGHIQVFNSRYELMKVLEEWITCDISGSHNWLIRIREKLRTFLEK